MNCPEVNQKIELFVLGGLAKSEQPAIKAHLASCPACAAAEIEYRLLATRIKESAQLDSLRARSVLVEGFDFARRVRSAVKAEIQTIALHSLIRRIIAITASAAACLLLSLVIRHVCISYSCQVRPIVTRNPSTLSLGAPSIWQAWQHKGPRSAPGSMADAAVVRRQNLYLLQEYGGQAYVAALAIKTGKQKWLSDIESCGYLLADDSRVYCLVQSGAGKFELVALHAGNGRTLWKYAQQCPDLLHSPCRPTLLPTGCICWTTNTTVQMLSCANGKPLWTHSIPHGGSLSAAAVVNNNLYVANAIALYCLNITTGDELWALAYGDAISSWDRPLLAAADEEIYASLNLGFGTSRLLCMELTGHKIRWSKVVTHVTHLYAIGDILYLRDQNVQALDRKAGQLLWTFPATGCNPVTCADGLVYFVDSSNQGCLIALDGYTGCKVWELDRMRSCNAFIKVDSTGFLKTHDGVVHAIVFKG
jgi:outer membrane protein assembly factor BamB